MTHTRIGTLALAFAVAAGDTVVLQTALAQRPKIVKAEGHLSPLEVRITFPDKEKRTALLIGMGYGPLDSLQHTHTFQGIGEGEAVVMIWLDTISRIEDTTDTEVLLVLKDGEERRLNLTADS